MASEKKERKEGRTDVWDSMGGGQWHVKGKIQKTYSPSKW
jgi:hypothetical protein